jgi:hypothetical protein
MRGSQKPAKQAVKILTKRKALQQWQAYSVLNHDAVVGEVDERYPEYLSEMISKGEKKMMSRLSYLKQVCFQKLEESSEEVKEMVSKRMKDDTLDIPEYLLEVHETVAAEEAQRYVVNYRRQE